MVNDNECDYYDTFLAPCQKVSFVTYIFLAPLLRSVSHSTSFHPSCLNSWPHIFLAPSMHAIYLVDFISYPLTRCLNA